MPKLTASNGTLYLDGDYCNHIGFNYYSALEKEWSNTAYDNGYRYKEDFPLLKANGIKVIKIMMTPYDSTTYISRIGNSTTTVNSVYFTGSTNGSYPQYDYFNGVDKLLETALANDIGIIFGLNWNYKTIPDVFDSGDYSKLNNPNSNSRIHWRMFVTALVDRYCKGQYAYLGEAIAGWSITNEAETVFNGTVTSPSRDLNSDGYLGILSDAKVIIKAADPYGRIVVAQTTSPIINARQKDINAVSVILARYYGDIHKISDTVELHTYPVGKFIGINEFVENKYPYFMDSIMGYSAFLKGAIKYAKSINKPLVVGEFGVAHHHNTRNSDDSPIVVTCSSVGSGVNTIPCANTSALALGMNIQSSNVTSGSGMSDTTVITAITPNVSFQISPATTNTTPTTLYAYASVDSGERMFSKMVEGIKNSGVQLSLCWNWNESKHIPSQNVWSVYPNIDSTRNYPTGTAYHNYRYKQLDIIVAANKSASSIIDKSRNRNRPSSFLQVTRKTGIYPCVGLTNTSLLPTFWNLFNTNGGDFTISFWYRANNINSFASIWRYGNDGINQLGMLIQPQTGSVLPNLYLEGKTSGSTTFSTAGSSIGIVIGDWVHVTMSLKTNAVNKKQFRIYTNGSLVSHSLHTNYSFGQPNSSSSTGWSIGTGTMPFTTTISDSSFDFANFYIFNRALTADEVFSVYNDDVILDAIAAYPFNSSTALNDISGNGFHLAGAANTTFINSPIRTPR